MHICICGWYLKRFDAFYRVLYKMHHIHGISVHIAANKSDLYLQTIDLPFNVRENRGLEFGAYDYYLKNIWDRSSSVLFSHDDIEFLPFVKNYDFLPPDHLLFSMLSSISPEIDQAYVFSSRREDVLNDGKHGRMLYCSGKLLLWILSEGGFLFDEDNQGYTMGERPAGVYPYNYAIEKFDWLLEKSGMSVKGKIYAPYLRMLYRGGDAEVTESFSGRQVQTVIIQKEGG